MEDTDVYANDFRRKNNVQIISTINSETDANINIYKNQKKSSNEKNEKHEKHEKPIKKTVSNNNSSQNQNQNDIIEIAESIKELAKLLHNQNSKLASLETEIKKIRQFEGQFEQLIENLHKDIENDIKNKEELNRKIQSAPIPVQNHTNSSPILIKTTTLPLTKRPAVVERKTRSTCSNSASKNMQQTRNMNYNANTIAQNLDDEICEMKRKHALFSAFMTKR